MSGESAWPLVCCWYKSVVRVSGDDVDRWAFDVGERKKGFRFAEEVKVESENKERQIVYEASGKDLIL